MSSPCWSKRRCRCRPGRAPARGAAAPSPTAAGAGRRSAESQVPAATAVRGAGRARGHGRIPPFHVRLRQRRHLRGPHGARRGERAVGADSRRRCRHACRRRRRPPARATRIGASLYWSRGGLATFEIRGRSFADCTSSPGAAPSAEVRGRSANFRARGNEPSWILEISPQQLTVITDLGERRTEFPYRDPTVAGARTTYRSFVGTQELVVAIDRAPCSDTMSGELFDSTVTVTFEGATLYGCGRGL